MLRSLSKLNSSIFNSTTKYISVKQFYNTASCTNTFNKGLDLYLKKYTPIQDLKNNLSLIRNRNELNNTTKYLDEFLLNINKNKNKQEIDKIKSIISTNYKNIEFNQYNYYKHIFCHTDFLSAYLIVWGKNAETNIHIHPSNGCFILNISGKWEETIYNSNQQMNKRELNEDQISFIDNNIGSHKVKYLYEFTSNPGISLNIYSPTSEIN